MIETKQLDFPLELKNISEDGVFQGYASVFNVIDNQKDVVLKGAFQKAGNDFSDVKLLWQHKTDEPIGIITTLKEDDYGLYIEGRILLQLARGKEAYNLLKSGAIDGLSIGYRAIDYENDYNSGIRYLKQVDLWEVSLVTFPANPAALVKAIKSTPATLREFENLLREAGFSRKQAKAISSGGFDMREACQENELNSFSASVDYAISALLNY